jgi:RNA polymerase sigma factor (sigma-70 family)
VSVDDWFMQEILPLEGALKRFILSNWRNPADVEDLRQEVYARVYSAACKSLPEHPKALLFTTARNLIIDQVRRSKIVSIETVMDLGALNVFRGEDTTVATVTAREEIRTLERELARLPRRTRDIFVFRKVEGLSQRKVASRLGVSEATVERHLRIGVLKLAAALNRPVREMPSPALASKNETKRLESE